MTINKQSFSPDEKERLGFGSNYGSIKSAKYVSNPRSVHFQTTQKLSARESTRWNIFTSARTKLNNIEEIRRVPTLLKNNVRLFTVDDVDDEGILYMKEDAFYNKSIEPEYALSVSPHIFRKMVDEVNDSYSLPLGLYFCCHGGDGAHSGIAHDDYVDIEVAYILAGFLFFVILFLVWILPTTVLE
mmetsp:Transcript_11179/g.20927  ORF Transcript_11179/g.20927 Transcript_11179/m.20927 type:complete len:186 (-) Transcript_11179:178-735(-)